MSTPILASEISGLALQSYNSGNVNRGFINTISSNSNDRYMHSGIVHTSFSSQHISSATILTNNLLLHADTISGLAEPLWPSSAANKGYVDKVSGSITTYANIQFYPSSNGNTLNTSYIGHSSNADLHYPSSQLTTWLDIVYAPSGVAGNDTSSQVTVSTGLSLTEGDGNIWHDGVAGTLTIDGYAKISSNAVSGQESKEWLESSGSAYDQAYKFSSNAKSLYYGSSNGNSLNISYTGHSGNSYPHSSNLRTWLDNIYSPTGATGSSTTYWSSQTGGIYYSAGEVILAPSGTDYGGYRFQVSGDSFFSGSVNFIGELSGLSAPTYNSGAANKKYVDDVSGNIITYANGQFYPSSDGNTLNLSYTGHSGNADLHYPSSNLTTWLDQVYAQSGTTGGEASSQVTISTGLNLTEGDGNIYHDGIAGTLTVEGYAKISSNSVSGQEALEWLTASGSEYDQAYKFSSNAINKYYASSLGNAVSGSFQSHAANTSNPHSVEWTDVETAAKTDLADDYYPSSVGAALSSNFQSHEANTSNPHSVAWADISSTASLDDLDDTTGISSPASGHVLTYYGAAWANKLPSMTFNVANIRLSSQQNINLTRFACPAGKKVYIWQACACTSGGASVSGLKIELLSGSTSVYSTSSATLQEGTPLAISDGGKTEIRFMYSGGGLSGIQYGTAFMNVSVL